MMLDGFISLLTGQNTANLTAYQNQIAAVTALTGNNVFKSVLPRGYTLPAIAIHRYGGTQDYEYDGPIGVREDQVQLDAYGDTAEQAQQVVKAVRALLVGFAGTLPDGTVVQAMYLERDMDMPFLPHADSKGIANRSVLGFRVVSSNV